MQLLKTLIAGLVCSMLAIPAAGRAQSTAAAAGQPSQATGSATVSTGGTKVHGTVTDPDGDLIPGATVTFTPSKGPGRSVKSGSDGTYSITVAPGSYTMLVSMQGFASFLTTNLKVPAVPSTTLDAKLKIGEETTVVNVEASEVQLSVDPDSNASSTILQGKDLEALSDDPDELSSELSALAGPSAGPNGGQIYVDGFTGGQLPPKASIREIRINQNPFSAEYDRLGYGRVEVFTKPGTDKLHGSFQLNGNPSQFNTENPLIGSGVTQPPYHTVFMFGSLTGPINKNASYSIGGSHRDIEDDAFTDAQIFGVPGTNTLCAPGQTGCTPFMAQFSTYTPQVRTDVSPRFDFALGDKNVLTARYQYVQNDQLNGSVGNLSLPSYGLNISSQSNELQLSDTQTWSSKLINETRFEYEREHVKDTPLSNAPAVSVSGTFTSGGNGSQTTSDHQDHFELQNYTSLQLNKNFIRFGGRLRVNREAQSPAQNTNGSFIYSSLQYSGSGVDNSYATGKPSQFTLTQVNVPALRYTEADLGLYAETDWKVRPNLTVSYGIRYETQNHLNDHHDIAPRISFAYGLGSNKSAPKTVLRGGFGLFYDRFSGNYILNLLRYTGANETVYTLSQSQVPSTCSPNDPNYKVDCISGATAAAQQTYTRTTNLRTPYITEFAGGFDQQVTRAGSVSVNYLHSQGVHQLATQNIGYPQEIPVGVVPGQNLSVPASYQYFSEGVFRQDQLIVNGRVSTGRHVSLFGYYSLNFAKGDTSGAGSDISTPYNIAADYGRTTFDTRNRIFLAGSISLPLFIQVSPFMIAQSGAPYNVTVGQDVNGDTFFNDRPYRVTGVTPNGSTVKTIAGCGTFAAPNSGLVPAGSPIAPINACTGSGEFTLNMRLTKTWGFGESRNANAGQGGKGGSGGPQPGGDHGHGGDHRGGGGGGFFGGGGSSTGKHYNFALGMQVQNIFGNKDLGTPNGTLLSNLFGQQTQLSGGPYTTNSATRRISLQASFNF